MSRKSSATKRQVTPDSRYGSEMVERLIRSIMFDGKKSIAARCIYGAMQRIQEQTSQSPLDVLLTAIENLRPPLEVKSRRVGGSTYQVPVEVRPERSLSLALRWLITAARKRSEKGIMARIAAEVIDASKKVGAAMGYYTEMAKRAEANKAFAHFRW